MLGAGFALSLLFGAPDARAQDGGGTSGQLEQGSATTDKEKQDFATQAIAEMQNAVKSVGRKLEAAEKEGDDLKIQCLSKKLSGIRALSEVSEDARATHGLRTTSSARSRWRSPRCVSSWPKPTPASVTPTPPPVSRT
jgi:hypothetical protein